MTNDDIYKLINFIIRKESKGSPDNLINFSRLLQQANLNHFKEEYQIYQVNQNVNDSISPFEVRQLVSGLTTSATTITLPTDYAHFIGMYWTDADSLDRAFDLVTDDIWDMRWASEITIPSDSYPICKLVGDQIYIRPYLEADGFNFYYGSGAQGLSVAQIQQLTADPTIKGDKSYDYSPTNQVYYVAYLASYGDLTSILDDNGFETISDWTKTVRSFTYNSPYYIQATENYNVYEFNNLTTQVAFTNTFKF